MNLVRFFKIRQRKVPVGSIVNFPMRKIQPERAITGEAEPAAAAEHNVENPQLLGDAGRPTEEEVGDDAERFSVLENLLEGGLERSGSF